MATAPKTVVQQTKPTAARPPQTPAQVPVVENLNMDAASEQQMQSDAAALEFAAKGELPPVDEAKAREDLAKNLPFVPANAEPPRLSPASAFPGEETKTMISPRDFKLQYGPGQFVFFKKGAQEVPTRLQEHPYLKAHGVGFYEKE